MSASTIKEILQTANSALTSYSDTPRLDAELLLAQVLNQSRTFLYTHSESTLTATQQKQFLELIKRRSEGEPVAYITGTQEFWHLNLKVTPDTLIPRPETELLVELALTTLPNNEALVIADLGTGSGAIALALASERPHWQLHATDVSFAALNVARENAQRLQLKNVHFYQGDWLTAIPEEQRFSAIISNPPYISQQDRHLSQLRYEPRLALIAEDNGLSAIRIIAKQAVSRLLPKGWLLLEHGHNQAAAVARILQQYGYINIHHHYDLAQKQRVVIAQFKD